MLDRLVQPLRLLEQLADREQPDQHGHELDPGGQLREAEGEALGRGHDVDADGGEQDAERAGDQVLDRRAGADRGQHRQAEHVHREVFGRPELVGETRQRRRRDDEDDDAEDAADAARHRRHAERPARLAALRHGIAVPAGHGRGARARRVHQDRRDRPGIGVGREQRGEHGERRDRLHHHREGQQERDRHRGADARQDADDDAADGAEQHHQQDVGVEKNGDACDESFHAVPPQLSRSTRMPCGKCTRRIVAKMT